MPEDPLRGNDDLVRIARTYFKRLTSEQVPRSLEGHAPFLTAPRRRSLPRRAATSVIAFVALAAALTLVVGVSHELSARQGVSATSMPRVASVATPTAALPPGGPAPPALSGDWHQGDTTNGSDLILNGNRYEIQTSGGFSFGLVAVNGNEIDFFNGDVCGIPLPGGVGRYRWSLQNGVLYLTPLNSDPCGGRTRPLANQSY